METAKKKKLASLPIVRNISTKFKPPWLELLEHFTCFCSTSYQANFPCISIQQKVYTQKTELLRHFGYRREHKRRKKQIQASENVWKLSKDNFEQIYMTGYNRWCQYTKWNQHFDLALVVEWQPLHPRSKPFSMYEPSIS